MAELYMKNKFIYLILGLALFLRVYQLGSLPISLFGDEIDAGYQAWSLATTLRDYRGHFLPTYIESLSEWRAPFLMYVTAPFVGLMGPSNFSVRLPSALFGVLSVYLIYLVSRQLYPNKKYIGEIAALVLTLSPWHLHYTRNATEQAVLLFLVLLGVYLYLRNFSAKRYSALFLIPFVLTFYTYSIANLFIPFLALILLVSFPPDWKKIREKNFILGTLIAVVIFIPICYQILFGQAAGRFKLINITNDAKVVENVILDRTQPWVKNQQIDSIFQNKYLGYTTLFISNYLSSFSPNFLFLHGDPNYRQSIARFGEVLITMAPFLLLGFVSLFRRENRQSNILLLLWLMIIPLPSALTIGGGDHASRLFLMNFPLAIIIALGVVSAKRFILPLAALLALNFVAYWYQYSENYRYDSATYWQYGYEPLFNILKPYIDGNRRIFINNTANPALYRYAFYTGLHPKEFQKLFKGDTSTPDIVKGFDGFRFGENLYFGKVRKMELIPKFLNSGDIYVAAQKEEVPFNEDWSTRPTDGVVTLGTVKDFRGNPLFYILQKP